MVVGIIGCGFVGSAISNAYKKVGIKCVVRDPFKGYNSTIDEIRQCDVVFICVPSPQSEDGKCDATILEKVVEDLEGYDGVVVSKVTAPPLVYESLEQKNVNLVYAPEFLTAANANEDYINSTFLIIGGRNDLCWKAAKFITPSIPKMVEVSLCSIKEASIVKYVVNSFLATKVIFMNEVEKLCTSLDISYDKVADAVRFDKRLGSSHFQVPGPDGEYGFGGACFPKDTSALQYFALQEDVDMSVLKTVIEKNNKIRGNV